MPGSPARPLGKVSPVTDFRDAATGSTTEVPGWGRDSDALTTGGRMAQHFNPDEPSDTAVEFLLTFARVGHDAGYPTAGAHHVLGHRPRHPHVRRRKRAGRPSAGVFVAALAIGVYGGLVGALLRARRSCSSSPACSCSFRGVPASTASCSSSPARRSAGSTPDSTRSSRRCRSLTGLWSRR
jgi:hypothetical protein